MFFLQLLEKNYLDNQHILRKYQRKFSKETLKIK